MRAPAWTRLIVAIVLNLVCFVPLFADDFTLDVQLNKPQEGNISAVIKPKVADNQVLHAVIRHGAAELSAMKIESDSGVTLLVEQTMPLTGEYTVIVTIVDKNAPVNPPIILHKVLRAGADSPQSQPGTPRPATGEPVPEVEVAETFKDVAAHIKQRLDVTSSKRHILTIDDDQLWENSKKVAVVFARKADSFSGVYSPDRKNEIYLQTLEEARIALKGDLEEDIENWIGFLKEIVEQKVEKEVIGLSPPEDEATMQKYKEAWQTIAAALTSFAEDDEAEIVNKFIRDYNAGVFGLRSPGVTRRSPRSITCFHLLFGF